MHYGFYSLTPSISTFRLQVSYLGYQQFDTTITLNDNAQLSFYLGEDVGQLEEIQITAAPIELQEQVNSTRMVNHQAPTQRNKFYSNFRW